MIDAVTKAIIDQLKRVKRAGQPVRVVEFAPGVDIDQSIYPAYSVYLDEVVEDVTNFGCEDYIFEPSVETATIPHPDPKQKTTLTGPKSYTVRPYPTPMRLVYIIGALATNTYDFYGLIEWLFQCFHRGCSLNVEGQNVVPVLSDERIDDNQGVGLLRRWYVLNVRDVFLKRHDIKVVSSIKQISPEIKTGRKINGKWYSQDY